MNGFGRKIDNDIANKLLDGFKKKFIISDYDPYDQKRSRLLWCNLSYDAMSIPIENFQSIPLDKNSTVYFYNERLNEMYEAVFSEICKYVEGLEPWEEIDAEIFDTSYEWFIAVTHEDFLLLYGL